MYIMTQIGTKVSRLLCLFTSFLTIWLDVIQKGNLSHAGSVLGLTVKDYAAHEHSDVRRYSSVLCLAVSCSEEKSSLLLMRQRAPDDGGVTAVGFLICQITLWHVPSQNAGNLFICAEEKASGGQLASVVRQLPDKRYITKRGSRANERQKKFSFMLDGILQSSCYDNQVWGAWRAHIIACCEVRHRPRSSSHLSWREIKFTQRCAKR